MVVEQVRESCTLDHMRTRRLWNRSRIAAASFLAAIFFVSWSARSFADKVDDALAAFVAIANVGAPKMVDDHLRFDGFGAAPDHTLLLKYTFIKFDLTEEIKDEFTKNVRPGLIEVFRESEDLKAFLRDGATIKVQYFSEAGVLYTEVSLSAIDL